MVDERNTQKIGCANVTCSISQELRAQQIEKGLSPSDCLKKGISLSLKEKEWGYDIWEKLRKMSEIISNLTLRNEKIGNNLRNLQKKHAEMRLE